MYSEHGVSHAPFLISFFPPFFPSNHSNFIQIIIANRCKLVSSRRDPSFLFSKYSKERERKKKRRKETRNTCALTVSTNIKFIFLKKVQRINSQHTNAHNRVRVVGSNYGSPRDTRVARITRVKSSSVGISCNDAHHTDTPPLRWHRPLFSAYSRSTLPTLLSSLPPLILRG